MTTTSHGVLNYFVKKFLSLLSSRKSAENQLEDFDESSGENLGSDVDITPQESQNDIDTNILNTDSLGYVDASHLQHLGPCKLLSTVTYISQAEQRDKKSIWNLLLRSFDADCALLKPPRIWSLRSNNVYLINSDHSGSDSDGTLMELNSPAGDIKTFRPLLNTRETILIELSEDRIGISMFSIRSKTQLLARGTSGPGIICGQDFVELSSLFASPGPTLS